MKILALDISTKSGWSVLVDGKILDTGRICISVEDFNVNDFPDKSPLYPLNMLTAANLMAELLLDIVKKFNPDLIVIENTVKGRNRHTQRILEWIHKSVLELLLSNNHKPQYRDPSWWRFALSMKLTGEDKKNNKLVRTGKKRGKIGKKHLSVRMANSIFNLNLKLKDNDIADSLLLGLAYHMEVENGKDKNI